MSSTKIIILPNASEPTLGKLPEGQEVFGPLNEVLGEHFYKPDYQAIRIVLGTIKAHYLKVGDPAWLFAVAPPGTGKTTMSLMGASNLPDVYALSGFTDKTFISGFHVHKEPGLLEQLGDTMQDGQIYTTRGDAIFLAKDFTTVLTMRRETRGEILGQLREIHDGQYSKRFGTGVTKIWRGRVSIIAAVTPVLDRYYSVFTTLGERFLQVRWHRPDSPEAGERAIDQQEKEKEIKSEVRAAVTKMFDASFTKVPNLSDEGRKRIANLAEVVAVGRTHVFRNSVGNREIEFIPEPESNTRISKGLAAIAKGLAALNNHSEVAEQDLQDVLRVGLDCLPERRRLILLAVSQGKDLKSLGMATTTYRRELEELENLEIVVGASDNKWKLSEKFGHFLDVANVKLEGNGSP